MQKLTPFVVVRDANTSAPNSVVVNPPKTGDAPTSRMMNVVLVVLALGLIMLIKKEKGTTFLKLCAVLP